MTIERAIEILDPEHRENVDAVPVIRCRDCRYYAYVACCNYLFDTGKPRPCPPGALCTVRRPGRHRRNTKKRW